MSLLCITYTSSITTTTTTTIIIINNNPNIIDDMCDLFHFIVFINYCTTKFLKEPRTKRRIKYTRSKGVDRKCCCDRYNIYVARYEDIYCYIYIYIYIYVMTMKESSRSQVKSSRVNWSRVENQINNVSYNPLNHPPSYPPCLSHHITSHHATYHITASYLISF